MFSYNDCFYSSEEPISHLLTLGSRLIVGAYDGTSEIRELLNPTNLITKITDQQNPFSCLACDNHHLYIGRLDGIIEIWNIDKLRIETTFQSKITSPNAIYFTNDFIIVKGNQESGIIERQGKTFLGFLQDSHSRSNCRLVRISTYQNTIAGQLLSDAIDFWKLPDLQTNFQFTKEEWISSILLTENFLLVGINACMELDEICTFNVWDLSTLKLITHLDISSNSFIYDIKLNRNPRTDRLLVVATAIDAIDIWEWGTWKHISRITDLVDVNSSLLINNKLLIGDINGRVGIWEKK